MGFLYFLEGIRMPGLNELMLSITQLGEEVAFLVVALVLFWCIDKRRGYYLLSVGFAGTILNQFMKLWFRIPRPWVMDENFTILEQAREAASGYSFPSGHTQSAVGTFGSIAYTEKNKSIRIVCLLLVILVPFSRMYIGVHTPLDVFTAAAIAVALIFLFYPLILGKGSKYFPIVIAVMAAMAVGYLCFVEIYTFPQNVDAENLASGTENAYTLLGAVIGMIVVYFADTKWVKFRTDAIWWAQILKVIGGLALVLAVKGGTKGILNSVFGELAGRSVRYAIVVMVAGILWPMTFRFFSTLGQKRLEDNV